MEVWQWEAWRCGGVTTVSIVKFHGPYVLFHFYFLILSFSYPTLELMQN